jgi:hypothetical protein
MLERFALRVLPKLGDVAGVKDPEGGVAAAGRRRSCWCGTLRQGAKVLVSTYNEPLITAEWAVEIFKREGRGAEDGILSNGMGLPRFWNICGRGWICTKST